MDRISGLPRGILHDILGRLPDKDAAKTCVLSKSWRETWFSFPILSLCSKNFHSFHDLPLLPNHPLWLGKLYILIEYVSKRLMRLLDQGIAIKELKLNLEYYVLDYMLVSHHVDQWIQMASASGVQVLELHVVGGGMDKWYNLPLCLTEAKSLTKLVLSGGIRLDPAFLKHSLKFFSMRTLSFSNLVFGDEGVMEHFISHCPLIEHLTLDFCDVYNPLSEGDPPDSWTYPVKSLSLQGLQKLKRADVQGIQERIDISGPQLKFLKLSHCYDNLVEVNIDAPNLLSCNYMGDDKPFISFQRISDQLEVKAYINVKHRHLNRLNIFFQSINPQKILASLSLFIHEPSSFIESLGALHVPFCPPRIKHVQLRVVSDKEAHYFSLMNWLLSSCFPESISFSLQPYFKMKAFTVYFYEMLMDSNKCKCDGCSMHFKRWWRCLKVVKVTHLGRTYENVKDLKAMLNALPEPESDAEEFITFALEL